MGRAQAQGLPEHHFSINTGKFQTNLRDLSDSENMQSYNNKNNGNHDNDD